MNRQQRKRIVNQLAEVRALLAQVPPNWTSEADGDDRYLTTPELASLPEPAYLGVIYAEDAEGKAIASLVTQTPHLLRQLLAAADQLLGEVEDDDSDGSTFPAEGKTCATCQHGYQFAPGEYGCAIQAAMRCKPALVSRQWMARVVMRGETA